MAVNERSFTDEPAVRGHTPMFMGLFGPTGSGKTYSALRLATGIQRIVGGDIFGIDTESNRMKHYADKFRFRHVPFSAPFSPDDYRAAIDHCVRKGGRTIIVDSATHEHEGQGGVLEWHEQETERLAAAWKCSTEKAAMAAWGPPKAARRKLIARILQVNANVIFCFRAREKLKIQRGKEPLELGWMPVGGEELFFEMTLSCLLLPTDKGVPTWKSDMPGERQMMKLPEQFEQLFGKPKQLDESIGEQLAQWAAGTVKSDPRADALVSEYARCEGAEALQVLEKQRSELWSRIKAHDKQRLKEASESAARRLTTPIIGGADLSTTQDQATIVTSEGA